MQKASGFLQSGRGARSPRSRRGKARPWGLITQLQSDAYHAATVFGNGGIPIGPEGNVGEYQHYHVAGYDYLGIYKHFHFWYGEIVL